MSDESMKVSGAAMLSDNADTTSQIVRVWLG